MKKLIVALSLLAAAFAAPAQAAGPIYAGLAVGDGFSIFGGYQIDKMISAQIDYTSYSSRAGYTACGVANCGNYANAYSLGFWGVATVPINMRGSSGLSGYGRVGLVHTVVNVWGWSYTDNSIGVGVGAQYDFNQQVAARLGIDFNNYYTNNLYIGALYRF